MFESGVESGRRDGTMESVLESRPLDPCSSALELEIVTFIGDWKRPVVIRVFNPRITQIDTVCRGQAPTRPRSDGRSHRTGAS